MLILRSSGRLAALVAAVALAGCGGSQGGGGGPCDYDTLQKGCVGLLNFFDGTAEIGGVTVPAPTVSNGLKAPGKSTLLVTGTSVSSASSFQATVSGRAPVSVSCTVTANGWLDVNPGVVLQPSGTLSCINW